MSQMKHPVVSVIIPIYNMEEYLEETLDSVLASDYPDLEIVLMDDGSKDRSLDIAQRYAESNRNVHVYTQKNAGVCVARNQAIARATGKYILPVDADNRISPFFIRQAVQRLEADEELKAVCCRSEFFGDRVGEWKLPAFSLSLLARKNMLDTCAMYRKSDWERIGGYCEEIIAREDWEFWIALLKNGGRVERLPETGLYYRVRKGSKRVSDRRLKRHVIGVLNKRHPDFFQRELGGPLRYYRSWSRLINFFSNLWKPRTLVVAPSFSKLAGFIATLPVCFDSEGVVIYKGRNVLKEFEVDGYRLIVKSYRRPHLLNRLAYTYFRLSKAARAYVYADRLRGLEIGSPAPVGYCSVGNILLDKSYFVSVKSECPYTYRDFKTHHFVREKEILQEIARLAAKMHEAGFLHKDFSAGNILFRENAGGNIEVEIIDLNRMAFGKVDMQKGCKNFERLPATDEMLSVMAKSYADIRGFDADECFRLMRKFIDVEENRRDKK